MIFTFYSSPHSASLGVGGFNDTFTVIRKVAKKSMPVRLSSSSMLHA